MDHPISPWLRRSALIPAVLALGALAACGGGSTDASTGPEEVASLEEPSSDGDGTVVGGDATLAADEAALEFSRCLRDEGLDVPDIGVDAEGNIQLRDALENLDPGDAAFREAAEACADVLGDAQFGGGPGALRDSPEFQDALLELSDCIREQGFDVGDLTIPQAGEGDGQPGGRAGAGERDGGFGDRGARLAERLGLDTEDPAVVAAVDLCLPILDTALADAGVGSA